MHVIVAKLIGMLFRVPMLPPIRIPFAMRLVPGLRVSIAKAFELAYYRGCYDGLIAGVLVALLTMPTIRSILTRGNSHDAESR